MIIRGERSQRDVSHHSVDSGTIGEISAESSSIHSAFPLVFPEWARMPTRSRVYSWPGAPGFETCRK